MSAAARSLDLARRRAASVCLKLHNFYARFSKDIPRPNELQTPGSGPLLWSASSRAILRLSRGER